MTLTLLVWGSQTKTNMTAGVNNLNPFIIFSLDTKTNMAAVRTF